MKDEGCRMKGGVRYYYVDEAGDPTLFGRRGKEDPIAAGEVSTSFILGLLDVEDPRDLVICRGAQE